MKAKKVVNKELERMIMSRKLLPSLLSLHLKNPRLQAAKLPLTMTAAAHNKK
jgi:hypothetical protein